MFVCACNPQVGEYNGKNLMASFSSRLDVNPEIPEAHELRAWCVALVRRVDGLRSPNAPPMPSKQARGQPRCDHVCRLAVQVWW